MRCSNLGGVFLVSSELKSLSPPWEVPVFLGGGEARNFGLPWEVPTWGGVFSGLKSLSLPWEVPIWGVLLVNSYPKSIHQKLKFLGGGEGYSLPRIPHSVWFWEHFRPWGPSSCITDSLSHSMRVETKWTRKRCFGHRVDNGATHVKNHLLRKWTHWGQFVVVHQAKMQF